MNINLKPPEPDEIHANGIIMSETTGEKRSVRIGGVSQSNASETQQTDISSKHQHEGTADEALAFDFLESPENWPDDPVRQAELAELLELHLAMHAHAEELAPALTRSKGLRRLAAWCIPAAAIALAVLPATYTIGKIRETRRMQARGAVVEVELQKRIQVELWSDFIKDSMDLLKQVQTPAKYCDPSHEDRSGEVEQARRLYAMGRSLPSDGLNDPETLDAKNYLQNWLSEVSANDACITPERSNELSALAREMDLGARADKLNRKLGGV